jgi:hypothetical protein
MVPIFRRGKREKNCIAKWYKTVYFEPFSGWVMKTLKHRSKNSFGPIFLGYFRNFFIFTRCDFVASGQGMPKTLQSFFVHFLTGSFFWRHQWRFVQQYWRGFWHCIKNVNWAFCPTRFRVFVVNHFLTIFLQLYDKFWSTFWRHFSTFLQLFSNFLTIFWQLVDNFFWQLFAFFFDKIQMLH